MSVQLVPVQVEVPKEMNDVRVALKVVIEDIKAGKSFTEIASDAFPKLVEAVNGIDGVSAEVKEKLKESVACIGLFGADVAGALLAPKPVQP